MAVQRNALRKSIRRKWFAIAAEQCQGIEWEGAIVLCTTTSYKIQSRSDRNVVCVCCAVHVASCICVCWQARDLRATERRGTLSSSPGPQSVNIPMHPESAKERILRAVLFSFLFAGAAVSRLIRAVIPASMRWQLQHSASRMPVESRAHSACQLQNAFCSFL